MRFCGISPTPHPSRNFLENNVRIHSVLCWAGEMHVAIDENRKRATIFTHSLRSICIWLSAKFVLILSNINLDMFMIFSFLCFCVRTVEHTFYRISQSGPSYSILVMFILVSFCSLSTSCKSMLIYRQINFRVDWAKMWEISWLRWLHTISVSFHWKKTFSYFSNYYRLLDFTQTRWFLCREKPQMIARWKMLKNRYGFFFLLTI